MNGHNSEGIADSDVLLAANEDAARFYRRRLLARPNTGPRNYLAARGLGTLLDETRWTIGYAPPGWTNLVDHLTAHGYSDATLLSAGLAWRTRQGTLIDRFRDRVTFGIRNNEGELVAFTARCRPTAAATVPKYLNTPTTALYNKGEAPFGLGEQGDHIRGGAVPVLVEGAFDALAVHTAQDESEKSFAALALCGTAISSTFVEHLAQLDRRCVVLAFDSDDAGNFATERAAIALAKKFEDVRAISRPGPSDLSEMLTRSGPVALRNQLLAARSASDYAIDVRIDRWGDRLDNAEAKVGCLRETAALLARLRPANAADHARRLSEGLGLSTETVTRELAEAASLASHDASRPTAQPTIRPLHVMTGPRATTRICRS